MKWNLLLIGALITAISKSHAQSATKSTSAQPISYQKRVPAAILWAMPRGSKSRFYGTFRGAPGEGTLAVNLSHSATENLEFTSSAQKFWVDVFSLRGTGRRRTYRKLNAFPVAYNGWGWAPQTFGAQLLWLDARRYRVPILKFDFTTQGDYGPSGDNVLLAFAHGWSKTPSLQSFNFGGWRASDTSGQRNTFDQRDENGQLQITTQIFLPTSAEQQPPPGVLKWDEKEERFR